MIERKDIIGMVRKAGIAQHGLGFTCWESQLERFAELVAAAEREACAATVMAHAGESAAWIADAIRARGKA